MFSKSTTNSNFDIGNPRPAIIKKMARSTILNVLNKRQSQEKAFTVEKKGSSIQERTAWRPEPTTRPNEHGGMKTGTRDTIGHSPKVVTSPVQKTVQQSPRTPSTTVQQFPNKHQGSVQTRNSDQPTKIGDRQRITKLVAEPVLYKTPANTFQTPNSPQSPSSISNLIHKWGRNEGSKSPVQKTPRKYTPTGYDSSPKNASSPGAVDKLSPRSPRRSPDDTEKGFSMIVQSSTSYPPPLRRKSSADVIPYNLTVNTIRIYEATPKMVEADPELLSRLERYPSREPPVMSPSSRERFLWEKDQITGIEKEKRAVVRAGLPIKQNTVANTKADVSSPKLVSDSVQVSIPFGVPASPTSPRNSDSGSDSWTSSVSVCVPFQVTEDDGVKALPVKGGTRPQSLPPADGTLSIEALRGLGTNSDAGSSPNSPNLENLSHRYDTSSEYEDFIIGKSQSYSTKGTGDGSPGEFFHGPKLVTVRRRPVEETVQKIIQFDDSLLQGQPEHRGLDKEDGMSMSKHGKYSFVSQKSDQTRPETPDKSSVVAKSHLDKPTSSTTPSSPGTRRAQSHLPQKTSTLPTTGKAIKKDEIEMLKARIRQLEEELEQERKRQGPSERILASIPILEKEKLRLQAQVNETLQELSKAKEQLHSATYVSNKHEAEKDILQVKYNKLQKDQDRIKAQNEVLEYERDQLLREKKNRENRANEDEKDHEANLITIQTLSKQNDELLESESKLKERICILVKGLREVKESVMNVREENVLLHDEIVDNGVAMSETMKKCVQGLQQVIGKVNSGGENKSEKGDSNDNEEIARLKEELEDSKTCFHALLQRVIELESGEGKSGDGEEAKSNHRVNYVGCPNCAKLQEELRELSSQYEEMQQELEKIEIKHEEMSNDNEDLQQEVKYLKKVLSYRTDVMQVQVSERTTRQMQRLETNLEEAERKCKDLEDEVGRLHNQKQSLLVNILKLHEEEVAAAQNGEEPHEDEEEDEGSDDDGMSDDDNGRLSLNRSKSSGKRSVYGNSEAEFSSGASFYESESESESDEWSELDDTSQRLQDYVKGIVSERKRLRSNIKELMAEKRNLNKRVDKSSNDFKSVMKRMQKLDAENVTLREKVKKERRDLKAKLKKEEQEAERLREKLKETESEKDALMKCIEMRSASEPAEAVDTTEELDVDDVSRLIAKAQAFALEEKSKSDEASEESEEEETDGKDEADEEEEDKKEEEEESEEGSSSSSEEEEILPILKMSRPRAKPQPVDEEEGKSDSDEERKRKEEQERKDEENDIVKDEMDDFIKSPPPPPHARLLQRRASTIGINMDRVSREKQHLEEEVASLKKYLNRSAFRRRYSTVETPKTPPLGAMKTLESLLQKSDMELKEANDKISRLQSTNADLEERIKDLELMHDDLRQAVVISNNYAAEEREKNTALEEERDQLLQKIELLKKENSRLKKSRAINAVYRKGTRSVKSMSANEEDVPDSDGADIESDFSSSRRSSNASDI
ncbi:trichohyalin-like [Actinia tenebrosa]|uniref:Trichohyalin-like n=1 Tax=Actinia tenebrosa TaxID=6105 RepID=A0A6P8J8Y5_ACTTE|nr:trichohyalin-like [Actinia tenebrosa]